MIAAYTVYEELARAHPQVLQLEPLGEVETLRGREPIYAFHVGDRACANKRLPVLALFAGVHGIEAIGVKILKTFIEHLVTQSVWNSQVKALLRSVKIVGIPIVNPAGYVAGTRSNGSGIDLMRNAPVESVQPAWWLVGGHRISRHLPWYRGKRGTLEIENLHIENLMQRLFKGSPFVMSLDIHSGFGVEDYLWTPYAKTTGMPPTWNHYLAIKNLLDEALKHHVYRFEPQSVNYCTSGDVWDYLYDKALANPALKQGQFLPLTLEVGSWVWVKKSPASALRLRSYFNPTHPHRERRVLRRHLPLLNLLSQMVASYENIFEHLRDKSISEYSDAGNF